MDAKWVNILSVGLIAGAMVLTGCSGEDGTNGTSCSVTESGDSAVISCSDGSSVTIAAGSNGTDGTDGTNGMDGTSCTVTDNGDGSKTISCEDGTTATVSDGTNGIDGRPSTDTDIGGRPLSSMVAVTLDPNNTFVLAASIPEYVKALVRRVATGQTVPSSFPLAPASTDTVRTIGGLAHNVVISWLDPLTYDDGNTAPRFGANNDYTAFFGDGWTANPYFDGASDAGWVWINHEYVSGFNPPQTTAGSPEIEQHRTLLRWLAGRGIISSDPNGDAFTEDEVNTYIAWFKRQLGGSWMRVVQDPGTGVWEVDLAADNKRYDSTSNTLSFVTGFNISRDASDDAGNMLPTNVVAGIAGDCSGGKSPWGTVVTAEENVQDYYGDLETAWSSRQAFDSNTGFGPGADVTLPVAASDSGAFSYGTDPNANNDRDNYGFLTEIDPGVDSAEYYGQNTAGVGHRKIGAFGRARWENTTFVVGSNWQLVPNRPIVMYAGNDRRSGRVYKFVSNGNWMPGMTKVQTRALLDSGTLYVAHFADLNNADGVTLASGGLATPTNRGTGRWIEMSTSSTDIPPNLTAVNEAGITNVGEALQSQTYNGIGGFPDNNTVLAALFTAAMKIGVMELNRPEDVEWNPNAPSGVPTLYIAFTNHTRQYALQDDGTLGQSTDGRGDSLGQIMALEEDNTGNPAISTTFTFYTAWRGTSGAGVHDAANPDNIVIDEAGGVWFGTDGNFGTNGHADSLYYLDLDTNNAAGGQGVTNPTFGLPFRVVAGPSDSEATGPEWTPDQSTVFFNVQHPGERRFSNWPQAR